MLFGFVLAHAAWPCVTSLHMFIKQWLHLPSQRDSKNIHWDQRGKSALTECMLCRPDDNHFANKQRVHGHEETRFRAWCDERLTTYCFTLAADAHTRIIDGALGLIN